jgi:putative endonuclease
MVSEKARIGMWAEQAALEYLEGQGLRLKERNFRSTLGEIDLIMYDGATLVFVEVRFRVEDGHGSAADSVLGIKQKKIGRTAKYYLQKNKLWDKITCRFDVLALKPKCGAEQNAVSGIEILWLKNAFYLSN